jgi:transcriptional regulator with XRE-family HTH domain
MTDPLAPTELGQLLEAARKQAGISGRTAATRSGISESRWRQIRDGEGGRPPAPTVVAAALGVGVDPAQALAATGYPHDPATITSIMDELARARTQARQQSRVSGLAEEIERVRALPLDAKERLRVTREIIGMYEDLAREQEEPAESGS